MSACKLKGGVLEREVLVRSDRSVVQSMLHLLHESEHRRSTSSGWVPALHFTEHGGLILNARQLYASAVLTDCSSYGEMCVCYTMNATAVVAWT